MSRAVSNLLIVLVMATIVTAILAFSSNTAQFEDPADGQVDDVASAAAEDAASDPTESFGGQTADALKDTADTTAETPETPAYLDPEPLDDPPAATNDAGSDAAVLGATVTQETSSAEELAETGPVEISQWLVMAAAAIATGGLARNAGRDHAEGLLTLVP